MAPRTLVASTLNKLQTPQRLATQKVKRRGNPAKKFATTMQTPSMPLTIVFDSNYLRSLGSREFLAGSAPEVLKGQLKRAQERGDLIALPQTVRMEINAFLRKITNKRNENIKEAFALLQDAGHTIAPNAPIFIADTDILECLMKLAPTLTLLEPTLEDYQEAERLTTFRLPPLPKNPDGEEMRDRLIWSSCLRLARAGQELLIVSNDSLLLNAPECEDAKGLKINVVNSTSDLDQRLGDRPAHIQSIIKLLLEFSNELAQNSIYINEQKIASVDGLLNTKQPNGSISHEFILRTDGSCGLPSECPVRLEAIDGKAAALVLSSPPINIIRASTASAQSHEARESETQLMQLKSIIGR